MISFENKVILFHFKIFVNVKYHGHEKYMDEDCTRKVATATCTVYTDHENMKTIYFLITSTKEVMFSPGLVCGFVCLCVCEQDNSKTY